MTSSKGLRFCSGFWLVRATKIYRQAQWNGTGEDAEVLLDLQHSVLWALLCKVSLAEVFASIRYLEHQQTTSNKWIAADCR
jgi:hypothetical protein